MVSDKLPKIENLPPDLQSVWENVIPHNMWDRVLQLPAEEQVAFLKYAKGLYEERSGPMEGKLRLWVTETLYRLGM